eukprot:9486228-Pyramimonas_sp.AAC.1
MGERHVDPRDARPRRERLRCGRTLGWDGTVRKLCVPVSKARQPMKRPAACKRPAAAAPAAPALKRPAAAVAPKLVKKPDPVEAALDPDDEFENSEAAEECPDEFENSEPAEEWPDEEQEPAEDPVEESHEPEEAQEGDDGPEPDGPTPALKIANGHNGALCIFLVTSGKDKCQILQVNPTGAFANGIQDPML